MSEKKYIITEVDYLGDTGSNTARLLLPGSIREYIIPKSLLINGDRVAYVERMDGTAHYIIKPATDEPSDYIRWECHDCGFTTTAPLPIPGAKAKTTQNTPPEDEWEAWEADMPVREGRKSDWVDAMLEWMMDRPREVE